MKPSETDLSIYSARDCVIQRRLLEPSQKHLREINNGPALMDLQSSLGEIADDMTWRGLRLNMDRREEHRRELSRLTEEAEEELQRIAHAAGRKKELNPRSTPQLRHYFYTFLGAKAPVKSKKTKEASTSVEALTKLLTHKNPLVSHSAAVVLKIRKFSGMLNTHVEGVNLVTDKYDPSYVTAHPFWRPGGALTGRWSSSRPNMMNIPKAQYEAIRGEDGQPVLDEEGIPRMRKVYGSLKDMYIPHYIPGYIVEADYCVVPETKVLTADLQWVNAGDLVVGQEVVGFPEDLKTRPHAFEPAVVEKIKRITRPCYKITTDLGSITVSAEHRLVRRMPGKSREWVEAQDLQEGDQLSFFVGPWEEDRSYEGGWFAGILDGEGWLARLGSGVGVAQNSGLVWGEITGYLNKHGYEYGVHTSKTGCNKARLSNARQSLRLIGSVRPKRLLQKAKTLWQGMRTWGRTSKNAIIQSIEYVGGQEVVAFKTSTGTFIGNGFLSHNCQIEARIIALLAEDMHDLELYERGADTHSDLAWDLFHSGKEKPRTVTKDHVSKTERQLAKIARYLLMYGGTPRKLYTSLKSDFPTITLKHCTKMHKLYFRVHHKVKQWQEETLREANSTGRVCEPLSGRERIFWGPVNPNEALNFKVQTAAGYIINQAIQDVYKELSWPHEGILLQLHDALYVDGPDPLRLAKILLDKMGREVTLGNHTTRFPVDVSVGWNCADVVEMGLGEIAKLPGAGQGARLT